MSVKRIPADGSLGSLSSLSSGGGSGSGDGLGSSQLDQLGDVMVTVGGFLNKIANFSLS